FAAGDNGIVLKTTNAGANWASTIISQRNLHSIFFIDVNTGYTAGDSGFFAKTTDMGVTWTSRTVGKESNMSVYFTNSLTGYVVSSSLFVNSLDYRTTDGGL